MSQNTTLWYAWRDRGRCRVLALDKNLLAPVAEKAGHPLQDISTNAVVSQLVGK